MQMPQSYITGVMSSGIPAEYTPVPTTYISIQYPEAYILESYILHK